jgi:hypothetical protein
MYNLDMAHLILNLVHSCRVVHGDLTGVREI